VLPALVALALVLVVAPARAGRGDAETLFAEGRRFRMAGNCAAAVVRFRQALHAYPEGLGSLRNIAECETKLGRYASARRSWWELRRRVLASQDPKYDGWDEHAAKAHRALDRKVARLVIEVRGPDPERARVKIVDQVVPPRLIGVALERDLGEVTITVHYGAKDPLTREIALSEGERERVSFTLPYGPPPDDTLSPITIGGITGFAVGIVGAVGFGVALGIRQDALADLETECPAYEATGCPASVQDTVDRGTTASSFVTAGAVVMGAGLVSGVALVLAGELGASRSSETRSSETRAALRVTADPGGARGVVTIPF
jgi:hypothetical protein